jgi:hypothetical protein
MVLITAAANDIIKNNLDLEVIHKLLRIYQLYI